MKWEDKLTLLHCIASDLQAIHSQNYIHRDLHSGNILQDTLQSANIADLGLSVTTSKSLRIESKGVYGILPYIPPEVLNNQPYTTASDIYSFGIIMWEILFGIPITAIYALLHKYFEPLEVLIVLNELRPPIFENLESCYIHFMKRCWENDPEKRPSAVEICGTFAEWQNNKKILFELNEYDKTMRQLMKGKLIIVINDNSKLSIEIKDNVNYSKEIYTDQFFNFITSQSIINHLESNEDSLNSFLRN
ncbi:kinase-like domain-containing protein [Gigaspora rosea]|uniref:Kinase-like domain-containing protein n=1 Tax=Gigaspora rosea TaxID=44941 RepID=A0A397UAT9_9GLOM|nr:kinase-like domain-containing protein [Gigaspora rosea]